MDHPQRTESASILETQVRITTVIDEPLRRPSQRVTVRPDLDTVALEPGIPGPREVNQWSAKAKNRAAGPNRFCREEPPSKTMGTHDVRVAAQVLLLPALSQAGDMGFNKLNMTGARRFTPGQQLMREECDCEWDLRNHASPVPPGTNTLITRGETARGAGGNDAGIGVRHSRALGSLKVYSKCRDLSSAFLQWKQDGGLQDSVRTIAVAVAATIAVAITGNLVRSHSSSTHVNLLSFKVFGEPRGDNSQLTVPPLELG